jgi:MoxR-like ATPase
MRCDIVEAMDDMTAARHGPLDEERATEYSLLFRSIVSALGTVIRGKTDFLTELVIALASRGHVLIEDLPGLGKTTVAKALARVIRDDGTDAPVSFKRIQFTPDLLPYDITGVDVFDPESRSFVFSPGPIFANIVLADEINRTTPKVQSALLEVMAENQVTIGNSSHRLDGFFFVIATQNPVETEGTYPLPAAQIDRFFMKLSPGYPDADAELDILKENLSDRILPSLMPVCALGELIRAQNAVDSVFCHESLMRAIVAISQETRGSQGIGLGISPRGSLMLLKASRAAALVRGRNFVVDQDILDMAPLVLAHRIRLKAQSSDPVSLIREVCIANVERFRAENPA